MSDLKQNENRVENKKAVGPFVIILIVSSIIGGILGYFSQDISEFLQGNQITGDSIQRMCIKILAIGSPFIMLALGSIVFGSAIAKYLRAKKEFAECDMEDEAKLENIEKKLNGGLAGSSVVLLVNYFLFAAHVIAVVQDIYRNGLLFFSAVLFVIASMIIAIILQQKIVDFVKEMNPEKQGSVYDVKFQKKWMDSCDEAEQHIIFQCGFKAYSKVNALCMSLFVVFFFVSIVFKSGLIPMAIVIGILIYSQLVYFHEVAKYDKK